MKKEKKLWTVENLNNQLNELDQTKTEYSNKWVEVSFLL